MYVYVPLNPHIPWPSTYPRTSSDRFTFYYPRHTCTHQHLLNSSTEHTTRIHATRSHGWLMYNSFLCVLPGSHFMVEWTGGHFGYKSCSGYRRLSVWQDSYPRSRGWESSALTTWLTVPPFGTWDPMGAKLAKHSSSHKTPLNFLKHLNFCLQCPHKPGIATDLTNYASFAPLSVLNFAPLHVFIMLYASFYHVYSIICCLLAGLSAVPAVFLFSFYPGRVTKESL